MDESRFNELENYWVTELDNLSPLQSWTECRNNIPILLNYTHFMNRLKDRVLYIIRKQEKN